MLSSSDCAHDEEWLYTFRYRIGQGSVGRIVGYVLAADEESH
jgi:hypothetical protein